MQKIGVWEKRRVSVLLDWAREGGLSAFYNELFQAVQIRCPADLADGLAGLLEREGFSARVRKAPELGQFPADCGAVSGRDRFAYVMAR